MKRKIVLREPVMNLNLAPAPLPSPSLAFFYYMCAHVTLLFDFTQVSKEI